jgi:hypothetical protein
MTSNNHGNMHQDLQGFTSMSKHGQFQPVYFWVDAFALKNYDHDASCSISAAAEAMQSSMMASNDCRRKGDQPVIIDPLQTIKFSLVPF